jgi:hypothetical protein
MKIIIEILDDDIIKQREQFISFAKFAKNYRSSRKVEKARDQWIKINNRETTKKTKKENN